MTITRRNFILGACATLATPAIAQTFGARPISIIVPFSPGGPTDFIARVFAQSFTKEIGANVIVENKAGASGNIGMQYVVDAAPDGLTIVHSTAAMQAINPLMYPTARFLPSRDLIPIGMTATLPNVLVVHPNSGIKSIADLVKRGKEPGRELTFATFGPGSSPHVYGSVLRKVTGINALAVPYKGSGNAIVDMLAGNIDFIFDSLTTSVSHIKAGKLVGLAITSPQRSTLLPDVPTLKETGYADLDLKFWFTLQVPIKTPPDIVERLRQAVGRSVQQQSYIDGLLTRGAEPFYVEPSKVAAFVKSDSQTWLAAAKSIGIKPE